MIFLNIGDGYSSGCCTGSTCYYAHEDPAHAIGALYIEHPNSRPGSFVNQLGEMYKAKVITIARHRTTIDEIIDSSQEIINLVNQYQDEVYVFFGVPDLFSNLIDLNEEVSEYLLLDGHDDTNLPEDVYIKLCLDRHTQDIQPKILQIENFLQQISNSVKKIIVYRTTSSPFNINVPNNCTIIENSIIELLKDRDPYNRGYFDKSAYKTIRQEFHKII